MFTTTTEFLTQFGIDPKIAGIWGSVLLVIFTLAFVIIKYRVIRLVAVDQATELVRTRLGAVRKYGYGSRKGRLVRLKEGGHLVIRGVHEGWPVSKAQMVSKLDKKELGLNGYGYIVETITINYKLLATDDEAGDEAILKYLLSTQDTDRENQISEGVRLMVEGIVLNQLEHAVDDSPIPVVSEDTLKKLVQGELYEYGVELTRFTMTPPSPTIAHGVLKLPQLSTEVNGNPAVSLLSDDTV